MLFPMYTLCCSANKKWKIIFGGALCVWILVFFLFEMYIISIVKFFSVFFLLLFSSLSLHTIHLAMKIYTIWARTKNGQEAEFNGRANANFWHLSFEISSFGDYSLLRGWVVASQLESSQTWQSSAHKKSLPIAECTAGFRWIVVVTFRQAFRILSTQHYIFLFFYSPLRSLPSRHFTAVFRIWKLCKSSLVIQAEMQKNMATQRLNNSRERAGKFKFYCCCLDCKQVFYGISSLFARGRVYRWMMSLLVILCLYLCLLGIKNNLIKRYCFVIFTRFIRFLDINKHDVTVKWTTRTTDDFQMFFILSIFFLLSFFGSTWKGNLQKIENQFDQNKSAE